MQDHSDSLYLTQLQLKNFRCFDQLTIDIPGKLVLIDGNNGSGKTSLLEALHYLCYLRSFRTHSPGELITFGKDNFFIKATFNHIISNQLQTHELQAGFTGKKRLVKIDQQGISSYKQLLDHYRIVTLTENDLSLITAGPEMRRSFLDQALLLHDATFINLCREYKQILDNRTMVIASGAKNHESYILWTEQLWQRSKVIQDKRQQLLGQIIQEVHAIIKSHFDDRYSLGFDYRAKKMENYATLDEFMKSIHQLKQEEVRVCRSLFGAHLDDFLCTFQEKRSKPYASRGQQKLTVLLIKIAQIQILSRMKGPVIFLLDDFMTDFDSERAQKFLSMLSVLDIQLIFTSPVSNGHFEQELLKRGACRINLTH